MAEKDRFQESIFNITGVLNEEFIEEVTESQAIKKNQIFFAILVNGLPGDPGFGVGVSELIAEPNTVNLKRFIRRRIEKTIPDLVEGVRFEGQAIRQDPENQVLEADLHFTDLETNEDIIIPLGLKQNQ